MSEHTENPQGGGEDMFTCEEREGMVKAINEFIVDPLSLLAGLVCSCGENAEEPSSLDPQAMGNLLGLVVRGARAELEIQRHGGYPAKGLMEFLGQKITMDV
jgi:hypothetical protein